MERNRSTDWSLLAGIGLVVVGFWLLGGKVLGPAWEPVRQLVHFLTGLAWPLVIIAIGALLIVAARRGSIQAPAAGTRLYRSRDDRMLSGVLAGVGKYLNIDPTWVRIAYVLMTLATSFVPSLIAYVIATVVIPEEPPASPAVPNVPQTPPAVPQPPARPAPTAPEPPASTAPEPPAPPAAPGA